MLELDIHWYTALILKNIIITETGLPFLFFSASFEEKIVKNQLKSADTEKIS